MFEKVYCLCGKRALIVVEPKVFSRGWCNWKRGGREASEHLLGVLPQHWHGTKPNRTVTCVVLKATAKDRRKSSPAVMNFVGLCLTSSGSGISNNKVQ
ncbi:hypothetical protein TNCV_1441911 [Trichonephila clavipes]|uniref:Uncharacterized protein n=1 Tax=Trichonephila clavipes TaxID=2585209 RepID=A0A8X6RPA3_TRICX|nr:hypothetical protein TNCV_1441911 [Trichonephila clavipes]